MGVKLQRPGDPGHPGGNRKTYVRVNFHGRRKTRTFNSPKGAQAYAAQVEAYLKLGNLEAIFAPPPAPAPAAAPAVTFNEAADRWWQVESPRFKGGTLDTYGGILRRYLRAAFGARALDGLTVAEIEAWWATLRASDLSHKHLANIRAVLDGVCRRAVTSGLLGRNPVEAIKGSLGRADREVRQAEWLSEAELTAFLAAAERYEPRYAPALLTITSTGLRVGEALGLQVGDVDLARGKLAVRRAVRKGAVGSPKSGKPRTVDVPPATGAVLRRWLDVVRAEAAVKGQKPLWLFPGEAQEPLTERPLREAMRRALKAAGIPRPIRLHDLRHTYASLAIQRGVPLLVVSRQLGHASISITADLYAHLAPDATRQAAEAWEAILTAQTRNPGATAAPDAA